MNVSLFNFVAKPLAISPAMSAELIQHFVKLGKEENVLDDRSTQIDIALRVFCDARANSMRSKPSIALRKEAEILYVARRAVRAMPRHRWLDDALLLPEKELRAAAEGRKPGRPHDPELLNLLHSLKAIYLRHGGKKTGAKSGGKPSIFLRFAWDTIQAHPAAKAVLGRNSIQALAEFWQRNRFFAAGKK
ncbi:hypothetical protein [Pseudomonas sp.]|uniref:hypothetical protein n=1 Tax=Pseudomonas sp. TaxID=306 RepID=UPI002604A550|nr:hypothetical protein [Pseudomonas sp.]